MSLDAFGTHGGIIRYTRCMRAVRARPAGAYLKHTGEFTVQYVLENRLLGGDGKISKSRKVKVMDVDECTYDGPHAEVGSCRHRWWWRW